ncbi:hypothetical protein FSP39_008399 [Pinctada imbricata]|uniref:Uncharacterized protein n=1 Tax=Pinctada imbricata TaxID=66713 RepID=A0AA88YM28_PINIB|nr:hypothetical protein FSP39_008399 [Pinctada imbricata]
MRPFNHQLLPVYQTPSAMSPVYKPPSSMPPAYQPPSAMLPVYQPPSAMPPVYQPPSAMPPVYQPPSAMPPVYQPPSAMPPVYQPPSALLPMTHGVSPVALPTATSSNQQLSPDLPPSLSNISMEQQITRPVLSNVQNIHPTTFSGTQFASYSGLPQSTKNFERHRVQGHIGRDNGQIREMRYHIEGKRRSKGQISSTESSSHNVMRQSAIFPDTHDNAVRNSYTTKKGEQIPAESTSLQREIDLVSRQIILRPVRAKEDIKFPVSVDSKKLETDYHRLINPTYATFMDNFIDLCENRCLEEQNTKKYDMFKIPKPSSISNGTLKSEIYKTKQSYPEVKKGCSKLNNSNEQYDRGKTHSLHHGTKSLVPFKNITEWTPDSVIEHNVHQVHVNKSNKGREVLTKPTEKKIRPKVDMKRKPQSLDFKDYTEWKNFMDSGSISNSSNDDVKNGSTDTPERKKKKLLPDTVIVIDDEAEDVTKENVWTGADNVKSCLGINLTIPRPMHYSDEKSTKSKQSPTKSKQEHCNTMSSSNDNVSTNEEKRSNLRNETQQDLRSHKQSSILVTLLETRRQSNSSENKDNGGRKYSAVESNVKETEENKVVHNVPHSTQNSHQHPVEDSSKSEMNSKESGRNSEEDALRKTYRNIVLNMSHKPMHHKTADALVTEILKEENMRMPTEDLTNLIVKLVRESTSQS